MKKYSKGELWIRQFLGFLMVLCNYPCIQVLLPLHKNLFNTRKQHVDQFDYDNLREWDRYLSSSASQIDQKRVKCVDLLLD